LSRNTEDEDYRKLKERIIDLQFQIQRDNTVIARREREINVLEARLEQARQIVETYRHKFVAKIKAGPPSDYQDLWFLCKDFRDELSVVLEDKQEAPK